MDKGKVLKISAWILGISLGASALLALIDYLSDVFNDDDSDENSNSNSSSSSSSSSSLIWRFPLRYGSGLAGYTRPDCLEDSRKYVKSIQTICKHYDMDLEVDGKWGSDTEAAVAKLKTLRLRKYSTNRVIVPFSDYVTSVTAPINSASKYEFKKSNYDKAVKWYNRYGSNYTTE